MTHLKLCVAQAIAAVNGSDCVAAYEADAHAAVTTVLAAIREPSDAMTEAGGEIYECDGCYGVGPTTAIEVWQAMIDVLRDEHT